MPAQDPVEPTPEERARIAETVALLVAGTRAKEEADAAREE